MDMFKIKRNPAEQIAVVNLWVRIMIFSLFFCCQINSKDLMLDSSISLVDIL